MPKRIVSQNQKEKLLNLFNKDDKPCFYDYLKATNYRCYKFLLENEGNLPPINKKVKYLYLYGPSHTGKTTTALWYLLNYIKQQRLSRRTIRNYYCLKMTDFFKEIKESYRRESDLHENDILEKFTTCQILIIDDIGVNTIPSNGYYYLYQLIDTRYNMDRATYYTSNLSLEQLAEQLNDDRLPSRIKKQCEDNIIEL